VRGSALTVVEADSVVAGVVRDAEIEDADSVVQALEDGLFLAAEESGIREATASCHSISFQRKSMQDDATTHGPV
jgi:hypothetical protein